jgi:hypothetical protein
MRYMVTSLCAWAKSCKNLKNKRRLISITKQNPSSSKLAMGNENKPTFLKPYQKLTTKLQIAIDEMNANFIVVLVQKLQLSKPRMKGGKNSITKNRKSKLL